MTKSKKGKRRKKPVNKSSSLVLLVIAVIIFAGAGLRLWGLGSQSLWLDEAFTAMISSRDVPYIIDYTMHDRGPLPLTYLFPWIAQQIAHNNSEGTLRFFDWLFGFLGLLAIMFLARSVKKDSFYIAVTVLLLSFSAFHHYYSREARGYTALVFLTIFQFMFLWKALTEKGNRFLYWLFYFLTLTGAFYFSMFAGFVLVTNVVWVLMALFVFDSGEASAEANRKTLSTFFVVTLLSAVSMAIWLAISLPLVSKADVVAEKLPPLKTLLFFGDSFITITTGHFAGSLLVLLVILAGFVLVPRTLYPVLLYPFLFLAIAFFFFQCSPITPAFLHSRYLITVLPFLILAFSLSLSCLVEKAGDKTTVVILVGAILGVYLLFNGVAMYETYTTEKQDWRSAGEYLARHFQAGDVIFGGANECPVVLFYYLPPRLRQYLSQDVPTARDLEHAMQQFKRVWYATAYYRWYYPWRAHPKGGEQDRLFYDWLDQQFDLVREFPGEYPVKIFLGSVNTNRITGDSGE